MLFPVIFAIGAALSQLEEPTLVPILYQSTAMLAREGEPMRLGSFIAPEEQLSGLAKAGVSLFFAETDRLGPPVSTEGPFSWDGFEAQRAAARAAGAEWSLGVYTTFPEAGTKGLDEGMVNLLTGEKLPSWSVWSQERLPWSANRFGAVNRRFPKLPLVTVGIHGETGDAGYFTGQAPSTWQKRYGQTAPSTGPWLGELKAKNSWRRRVETSYGTVDAAYRAWQMEPPTEGNLGVPLDPTYTYSARLTLMDWYRSGIASLAASLSDIADNVFKDSTILIPVGPPNDLPYVGLDVFRLAEAVKGRADAIKVTSVGFYDFPANWAMNLARIRGAAVATDTPVWTEAGTVQPTEFEARLFEAICLGSRGHTDAPVSISGNADRLQAIASELLVANARTDVAVLHPTSSHLVNPTQIAPPLTFRGCVELRDYLDFDVLEESAVIEGALRNYRVAVIFEGSVWDSRALSALKAWVEEGGVVLAYDFGKMADPPGNTAVYQALFGFASELKPAPIGDQWIGEQASSYRIDIGGEGDTEFLLGQWGPAHDGSRNAANGSSIRLPFAGKDGAVATLHFSGTTQGVKSLQLSSLGKLIAGISLEGGLAQVSIAVDKSFVRDGAIVLQIGGLGPGVQLPVDAITVTEPEGEEGPKPLVGHYEADVPIDSIREWTKKVGKGLSIFYPAKRDQWKGYISVIRAAVHKLNVIEPGRSGSKLVDDRRDSLYVADLGNRLAVFNANTTPITRTLVADKPDLTFEPHQLSFVNIGKGPSTAVALAVSQATEGSPADNGLVRVAANTDFAMVIRIGVAGRYRLFARTLRAGALAPVGFNVNGAEAIPPSATADLDTYLVGDFDLPEGESKVVLRSERPVLVHLLVLTDRPQVRGFRIRLK